MVTIRKTAQNDFELVYPLLKGFNSRYLSRQDWERLFYRNWDERMGYCGYVMLHQDKAVGFLGLLFNERIINDKKHSFCNVTSWIVEKEYRSKSIFMLQPVLKLKSHTITDLTPSREVYKMLRRSGFKDLESHYRFISAFPGRIKGRVHLSLLKDAMSAEKKLDKKNLQIYYDHQFNYCHHILIESSQEKCYIVVTKMMRRRAPFFMARVHYISNKALFSRYLGSLRIWLGGKLKVLAIVVDERFLTKENIGCSVKRALDNKSLFRSSELTKDDIDNLYSELILFNI